MEHARIGNEEGNEEGDRKRDARKKVIAIEMAELSRYMLDAAAKIAFEVKGGAGRLEIFTTIARVGGGDVLLAYREESNCNGSYEQNKGTLHGLRREGLEVNHELESALRF